MTENDRENKRERERERERDKRTQAEMVQELGGGAQLEMKGSEGRLYVNRNHYMSDLCPNTSPCVHHYSMV